MTPTEQRIAIAEACGWFKYCVNSLKEQVWHKKIESKYADTAVAGLEELPDYLNDLNAMHEALHSLDEAWKVSSYRSHLVKICGGTGFAIDATAAQRAEAFLRTIGKWKD